MVVICKHCGKEHDVYVNKDGKRRYICTRAEEVVEVTDEKNYFQGGPHVQDISGGDVAF